MTDGRPTIRPRRLRITTGILVGVAAGMLGLSFASVPLYRMFCQATGYDGTPKTVDVARSERTVDRIVTVRFDANVNSALPWSFEPVQHEVRVKLGEETLIHYTARNNSDRPITGQATFNIVPEKAAQYFNKIACFCFDEQTLDPRQEVDMPVLFYVDPALADDPTVKDVTQITLSYTFYRVDGNSSSKSATARSATARLDTARAAKAGG